MNIVENSREVMANDHDVSYAGSEDVIDPATCLIDILRRAIANKQDVRVELSGGESISLFPTHGEYFSQMEAEDEERFYSAQASEYRVECLYPDAVEKFRASGVQGRNLDEALWKTAIYVSRGNLIGPCQRDDVIELMYWPNITRLPKTPNTLSLAAFFSRYPTSVTLASRILKVPLSELFTFYSAAYSAGLVKIHNRVAEPPKFKPHKDSTFLGQLLTRLTGI